MAEINFRTDEIERQEIAARNRKRTLYILKSADINESNPDYQRYFNATIVNVHNAYRYSYNGETEADLENVFEGFIATIKENTLEQYEQTTKAFLSARAEQQLNKATGEYAHQTTYDDMRKTLNKTVQSGVAMRAENKTIFPKEFYLKNGGLKRLVYDIDLDMQSESAMRNIDMIVAKYKDKGVDFDASKNRFMVKGQEVGPQKFFASKHERLEKFLSKTDQNSSSLDLLDQELLSHLEKGDWQAFSELRKQRGIIKNRKNEDLRTALSDEIVFHEVSAALKEKGAISQENILGSIFEVSENFKKTAELISKESEKDVLGRIDRVMFSVTPYDLATQSTFRDWKSCMHTTGCYHQYVDDSIGLGSIVAYGYDSQNPSKMVSRLLIQPHEDEQGNIAYKVNDRIYGRDNLGFRKAVEKVTNYFNEGKEGLFKLKEGLYDDNSSTKLLLWDMKKHLKDGVLDLTTYPLNNGEALLDRIEFKDIRKITAPEGMDVRFYNCEIACDVSELSNATYKGCFFAEGAKLHSFQKEDGYGDIVIMDDKAAQEIVKNHIKADNIMLMDNVSLTPELLECSSCDVVVAKPNLLEVFKSGNWEEKDYHDVVLAIVDDEPSQEEYLNLGIQNVKTRKEYTEQYIAPEARHEKYLNLSAEQVTHNDLARFECESLKIEGRIDNNGKSSDLFGVNLPKPVKNLSLSCIQTMPEITPQIEKVSLRDCSFKKGDVVDLSHCKEIDLQSVDLSTAKVILPHKAERIYIGEDVHFPPDYQLDLSNCKSGFVDESVSCTTVKMPKESTADSKVILPPQTKEVPASFILSCYFHVDVPDSAKIVDSKDEKGKHIPLKILKNRGLSKKQLLRLKKERLKETVYSAANRFKKLLPSYLKSKFSKKKTPGEIAKNKRDYRIVQSLRGIIGTKRSHNKADDTQLHIEENVIFNSHLKDRDDGR